MNRYRNLYKRILYLESLLLDEGADVKYLYKRFDKLKADELLDKFGLSKYKP